jgi:hypothetical protein
MEDEILLAEKVGSLQEQLEIERRKCGELLYKIGELKREHLRSSVFQTVIALVIIALIASLPIYFGYQYLFNKRPTGYCYIEQSTYNVGGFGVYQEVDWAQDNRLGVFFSYPEALEMLQSQNCEVVK